jgi:hypothetical protein
MKETISIFVVMCIIAAMTSCAPKRKYHCKGLSAHPNYKTSWFKH